MANLKKQIKAQKHPKPAPFDLGASDLSVITKKLVSDRRKSIIKTHLKTYWNEYVKGSVRGRCEFSGTIREYFWSPKFIPQKLEDAIYEILQQTAKTCPKDNLRWYVKEAGIILKLGLVNRVYDYMVHLDQQLRTKGGNLKSVKRVPVYDDKVPKMHKLVEQYVTAVNLISVSPKETTTAGTEQGNRGQVKMAKNNKTFDPQESAADIANSLERFANQENLPLVRNIKGIIGGKITYHPFTNWLMINRADIFKIFDGQCNKVLSAAEERDRLITDLPYADLDESEKTSKKFLKMVEESFSNEVCQKDECLRGCLRYLVQIIRDIVPSLKPAEASGKAGETEQTHPIWTSPLGIKKWASIFKVSESSIRRWFKDNKYENKKISDRKWSILYKDLPAEVVARVKNQA